MIALFGLRANVEIPWPEVLSVNPSHQKRLSIIQEIQPVCSETSHTPQVLRWQKITVASWMRPALWKSIRPAQYMVTLLQGTPGISHQTSHKPGETETSGMKRRV